MINLTEIEYTPCPLCSSEEFDNAFNKISPFAVVRCRSCGFYYLSPRLKESAMLQLYKNNTYFECEEMGYKNYLEQEDSLQTTFRHFMKNLEKRHLTGGNLLEIGCGYGYLLEEAKNFFDIRAGVEFSHKAAEQARKRGDHLYEGDISQIPPEGKYDCIVAIHVIEHIYQPREFIKKLILHLKPNGKIVLATPDMGSFWRYLMGNRWPSFKIPEHILYFDKKSLSTLMLEAGLTHIKLLPYPHAFPLSLVAEKLGAPIPSILGKLNIWLPGTTLAIYGVAGNE